MNKTKRIIISIIIPLALGTIFGIISNTDSYSVMNKPSLSPPAIVFPIVWSILYILMGISYYQVNKEKSQNLECANLLYYVQLVVNVTWPIVFFNFKEYLISLIWIIILIIFVILMINEFRKINKTAAYLQIPYLLWLIFATYLNYQILILN